MTPARSLLGRKIWIGPHVAYAWNASDIRKFTRSKSDIFRLMALLWVEPAPIRSS